jgi:hypothetical protein
MRVINEDLRLRGPTLLKFCIANAQVRFVAEKSGYYSTEPTEPDLQSTPANLAKSHLHLVLCLWRHFLGAVVAFSSPVSGVSLATLTMEVKSSSDRIGSASIGGAVKPVLSHCKARLAPLF